MISHCAPSDSLYLSLREWPRLPFTARIERAPFHRARSASKKGTWPLSPSPLFCEQQDDQATHKGKRDREDARSEGVNLSC